MTLNMQHLVEWFSINTDAPATKLSPGDAAGRRAQPVYGCCRLWPPQQPESSCGAPWDSASPGALLGLPGASLDLCCGLECCCSPYLETKDFR